MSDKDYFLCYKHECDWRNFDTIKQANEIKPKCNFGDYAGILVNYFNQTLSDRDQFPCTFQIEQDNSVTLMFHQNLGYKQLQLFECCFEQETDSRVKLHIKYRYRLAQAEFIDMQARFDQICDLIK